MIKVTFNPEFGLTVPDARSKQVVEDWIRHGEVEVEVANFLLIEWLRVMVKTKKLSLNGLELYFKNGVKEASRIEINENGRIEKWPSDFGDHHSRVLRELSLDVV